VYFGVDKLRGTVGRIDSRGTVEHSEAPCGNELVDGGTDTGELDWASGAMFQNVRQLDVEAPYGAVCRVGGGHGWYAAD
jgi:hypothetical protein